MYVIQYTANEHHYRSNTGILNMLWKKMLLYFSNPTPHTKKEKKHRTTDNSTLQMDVVSSHSNHITLKETF